MYADYTVVYASGKTCNVAADQVAVHLEKVSAWLDASCLTLNTKKTISICFSTGRLPVSESLSVKIKGEPIEQVTDVKNLGLILGSQLKFNKHTKKINTTVKTNLNCFRLIRNSLPFDIALLFLNSMVFSHMSY